jgi:protein-disulfide isomerase
MSRTVATPLIASTLALGVLGAACGSAAQTPSPSTQSAQSPASSSASAADPVAVVDGAPVTRDELEAAIAPRLAKIEEEAYELRRQQLDDLIDSRLLATEAKRRGVTVDALIAAEVTAKVPQVTKTDVDQFIQANRARLPADPMSVAPQIRAYLANERTGTRRQAFVEELRAKSKIEVRLEPPTVYRAQIEIGDAPIRGPKVAPVTIVEYSDFHCPFCRRVQPTLLQVLAKYPTQVRLVYKHFPLDSLHPQARRAAEASWCAAQQNRFWEFHDAIYGTATTGDEVLTTSATRVGLNMTAFDECLQSGKAKPVVQAQLDEGEQLGVSGTPGFFVNGRLVSGAIPLESFTRLVDEELARK